MVFIPKPGRDSYEVAKAYRPISLTSFLLKTMEKLVDRHIKDRTLVSRPLHPNQHAYQTGKSCETALHALVSRIEQAITYKEVALATFLDIEGAFDNTSTRSIVSKLVSRGVEKTIVRWVSNELSSRRAQASLCGSVLEVKTQRGCPQGGILSPNLWNLVVDDLLAELNEQGLYAQGYADDIVILIRGKHMATCLELMQRALSIVEKWCKEEGLKVNPLKTVMVPFTRKRKVDIVRIPALFGRPIQVEKEFKYLGVRLDSGLTWNSHLVHVASRSQTTLMMARRAVGCTWGLQPKMVNWLYTRVVRPMMVYGSVIWWPKVQQITAVKTLTKVQRMACLGILGAFKGTSTAAMEVLLNLPPLDIFIKGEARMAAYRMSCVGHWRYHTASEHTKIEDNLRMDTLAVMSDRMKKVVDLEKPYRVHIVDRNEWSQGEPEYMKKSLTWYTDGSKRSSGTGAGVYGVRPRVRFSISLGKLATVFQAEVTAIAECARANIRRGVNGQSIYICSDSMAALAALTGHNFTSKAVWDCHTAVKRLAKTNRVSLLWVPGHSDIAGNEGADRWANIGAKNPLIGPEPTCGVSYSLARGSVQRWVAKEHQKHWERTDGNVQAKRMMRSPSERNASDALKMCRKELRKVVGFITGHWEFRGHLHKMGKQVPTLLCRKCGEEEEVARHLLFRCPALAIRRNESFGALWSEDQVEEQGDIVKKISWFVRDLGFDRS